MNSHPTVSERIASIPGPQELAATILVPHNARGVILFAHGSGSNRFSPRNAVVAEFLREHGFATVLLDLLTEEEQRRYRDENVKIPIATLGKRVTGAASWIRTAEELGGLPLGLFGASTGAAAALIAAGRLGRKVVRAVISRGGRPDLAADLLSHVLSPTLLIVGGRDAKFIAINNKAFAQLGGIKQLATIPNAGHLFEEPGSIEEVNRLSADWLLRHVASEAAAVPAARSRLRKLFFPRHAEAEPTTSRTRLLRALKERAFITSEKARLVAENGNELSWLFDFRPLLLDPRTLSEIARAFWEEMKPFVPFQLAALEMSGIPLMTAIQMAALDSGVAINGVVLRKERKRKGRQHTLEGHLNELPIFIVDDIVNSGSSLSRAAAILDNAGRSIDRAFAIVDFREASWRSCEGVPVAVTALFRLSEFGVSVGSGGRVAKRADPFRTLWRFDPGVPRSTHAVPKSSPVLDEERLYFGCENGRFYAIGLERGEVIWEQQITSAPKGIWSSPALCDDFLFFGAYDGRVHCLGRHFGEIAWQTHVADWVGSSPCIAHGLKSLFIGLEHAIPGRKGGVAALECKTGTVQWFQTMGEYVHASPLFLDAEKLVVVADNEGALLALDAITGTVCWRAQVGGAVKAGFARHGELIIFGSFNERIQAVSIRTGELAWTVETEGAVYATPAVIEGHVFVTSMDKHLYLLNPEDGSLQQRVYCGSRLLSSPVRLNDTVVFGSVGGAVIEYDLGGMQITGKHQLPEEIAGKIAVSEVTGDLFVPTLDNQIFALRRR